MKTKHLFLGLLTLVLADNTFGQSNLNPTPTATGTLPASPTQFLGFTNGADLIFKLGNVERMRLKNPVANVDPGGKLVLTGAISTTIPVSTTSQAISVSRSVSGPFAQGTPIDQMSTGIRLEHNYKPLSSGTYTNYRWDLLVHNTGIRFHEAGDNAPSFMIKNGGFVGIGTPDPSQKLNVKDGAILVEGANSYGGPMLLLGNNGSNNNTWGIENAADGLNFWRPFVGGQANQGNYFLFLKHSTGNVGIKTNDPKADLHVNGKVIIGTQTITTGAHTDYKLAVDGKVVAKEIYVTLNDWADYVFADDYKRLTLKELEEFVSKNKHLPNVPTTKEVMENGSNVGDMNRILLEKIEELTLYILEQQKEIDALKEK